MSNITGEEFGALLFNIHSHKGDGDNSIVYYEVDLLPILEALGLPKPVWGGSMTLKQWKKKHAPKYIPIKDTLTKKKKKS